MRTHTFRYIIHILIIFIGCLHIQAQTFKNNSEKGEYYLERALSSFKDSKKYAVVFESVAFGLKDPLDILSLPTYKVYKGGHLYADGKKYEYNTGAIKILCDSKLMVFIDETNKMIMIDSVRKAKSNDNDEDFVDPFQNQHGSATYEYLKIDTVRGRAYHKVKCSFTKNSEVTVLYWIDVKNDHMFMYSEFQEGAYSSYLVDKVSSPPPNYKYGIYLPKTELTTFQGYEVIDNRFVELYGEKYHNRNINDGSR